MAVKDAKPIPEPATPPVVAKSDKTNEEKLSGLNESIEKNTASVAEVQAQAEAATAQSVYAQAVNQKTYEDTNIRTLEDPSNLDNQAWFDNQALVTGNPHLREIATPITFTLNLTEFDSSTALKSNGKPLELQLNCSLSRFSINMKHIINKSNTRTGFHLTFWGMEPDTITGSGSTGVFMNQWGVTSLMSLDGSPDSYGLSDMITDSLQSRSGGALASRNATSQTQVMLHNSESLRIAAQDAFIELLSLFRNNGLVHYDNPTLISENSMDLQREQMSQNVYSEKFGDSTYTRNARQNDVMVKGNIDFHYKSNLYQGYFKSLAWILDSEHPFHWQFDFVFQVQKTFSQLYYPRSSPLTPNSR